MFIKTIQNTEYRKKRGCVEIPLGPQTHPPYPIINDTGTAYFLK